MADYMNYFDFRSLKLAELAEGLGDYKLALSYYSKALKRLKRYPGDRMLPIQEGAALQRKVDILRGSPAPQKPILRFDRWMLTKTSFVKGSKCHKYLYLDKHKKHEQTPFTDEQLALFQKGHNFEDRVRDEEFPGGLDIKKKVGNFAYFNSYTKYLLSQNIRQTLYEATIIEDGVLVMCDILVADENGRYDIYEIKLNSSLNQAILDDLAIQFCICKKRFGNQLNSFNVILREQESENSWQIIDVMPEMQKRYDEVEQKILDYKKILSSPEPDIPMGKHCYEPYNCQFIDYCKNQK